jgi:hypothetical protein
LGYSIKAIQLKSLQFKPALQWRVIRSPSYHGPEISWLSNPLQLPVVERQLFLDDDESYFPALPASSFTFKKFFSSLQGEQWMPLHYAGTTSGA